MAVSSRREAVSQASLWRFFFGTILSVVFAIGGASHARAQQVALPSTLDQLLQPGAFAIVEDKRFDNFMFSGINSQGMISPATIQVTPLTSGNPFPDPGLFFSSTLSPPSNYILDPALGTQQFNLSYDVTVLDPTMLIKDNLLELGAPAPPPLGGGLPGPGNFAQLTEDVTDLLDDPLASKLTFSNDLMAQIIDTADFTPQTTIHVDTNGLVVNTGSQPPAFIQTFSQTFSQLQVPEPAGIATWGIAFGMLLLTWSLGSRLVGNSSTLKRK